MPLPSWQQQLLTGCKSKSWSEWDVWRGSDQIWQMSEHWSHECHEECHDVCHVPSAQAKTSVFLIRSQVVNKEKPKSTFYLQKVETIIEIKHRVVYASVSNNCHENINQQSDILQVTGCWGLTAVQCVGGAENKIGQSLSE